MRYPTDRPTDQPTNRAYYRDAKTHLKKLQIDVNKSGNERQIGHPYIYKEIQGRIDGNQVADGWAGAVLRKPLTIQKCYGRTDGPTRQGVNRVSATKD